MRATRDFRPPSGRIISAILSAVKKTLRLAILGLGAFGVVLAAAARQDQTVPHQPAPQEQSGQSTAPQQSPQQPTQQAPPSTPARQGPIIILDPAHGGADTGARGSGDTKEKDLVLLYARVARIELERQGFRVLMTRNDDSDPSYDDRAAIANAHHDALLVSFHISSTGAPGTAHAYYYQFPDGPSESAGASTPAAPSGVTLWEEAQRPYVDSSKRFADLLSLQLAQRFSGSPITSAAVPVRELRSVAIPAVAVEIASVSTENPNLLGSLAQPLAVSISRTVQAFRPPVAAGGK